MNIKLAVEVKKQETILNLADSQGKIIITSGAVKQAQVGAVLLLIKKKQFVGVTQDLEQIGAFETDYDQLIEITPSWEIEANYLEQSFLNLAAENNIPLKIGKEANSKLPKSAEIQVGEYVNQLQHILKAFGYELTEPVEATEPAKKKPGKAQHRWNKAVSQVEFSGNFRGSQGRIIWQKRNEMLLKAGAKLVKEAPLNKDGSVGYSAKMGDKLRSDYSDKIVDFQTTEDIILKSVNEVGLFLYYAGTNGWLQFFDEEGKTIDSWTVVE